MHFHRAKQFSPVRYLTSHDIKAVTSSSLWAKKCILFRKKTNTTQLLAVTLDDRNVNNSPYGTELWRRSVYDPAQCVMLAYPPPVLSPLTLTLSVSECFFTFFKKIILECFKLNPCTELSLMFSFLIFSVFSPTVVVNFLRNVLLTFVLFVCQSYACLFEIYILYCRCNWCVLVRNFFFWFRKLIRME